MPYGYGFGFRGYSPPWPYVGRGRGGLPRCWYPAGGYGAPAYWPPEGPYAPYAAPWPGAEPRVDRDTELDFLRQEARAAKDALDNIEARISELESKES